MAERANGILKSIFLDYYGYKLDLDLMTTKVKESIDIYNNEKPHYCYYLKTPNQMHKQKKIKVRTYKTKNHREKFFSVVYKK